MRLRHSFHYEASWPVGREEYVAYGGAKLGVDSLSNDPIAITEVQQQNGIYILGKPGTGKSILLASILRQNIEDRYGAFFIDPHGDTIKALLDTGCGRIWDNACPNTDLWEHEWGPWLQLIIQNTLYVFVENQGYTLAEYQSS